MKLIILFTLATLLVVVYTVPAAQKPNQGETDSDDVKSQADSTADADNDSQSNASSDSGTGSIAKSGSKADNKGLANAASRAFSNSSANALSKADGQGKRLPKSGQPIVQSPPPQQNSGVPQAQPVRNARLQPGAQQQPSAVTEI